MKRIGLVMILLLVALVTISCASEETPATTVNGETSAAMSTHIHSYSKEVTAPTCTEKGYTTYTCSCGDTYTADVVAAKGHYYTGETTNSTCTDKGYTTYTCSCGDTYTVEIVATGHAYTGEITKPTCTEQGYTTYTCFCGDFYVSDYTEKTSHSYNKMVIEPTCTDKGYTMYTCSCGDTYKDDYTNPSHSYFHYKCLRCGAIDKSQGYNELVMWLNANGETKGEYTEFEDKYKIIYSHQNGDLIVSKRQTDSFMDYRFSLSLLSYYYDFSWVSYLGSDEEKVEVQGYGKPAQ